MKDKGGYEAFFKKAREANLQRQAPAPRKKKIARPAQWLDVPMGFLLVLSLLLGLGLWVLSDWSRFENLLSRIEIRALGLAVAEEKAEAPSPSQSAGTSAGGAPVKEVSTGLKTCSPEELAVFNRLEERKKTLDDREAELNRMDEELGKQRAALDSKLKELKDVRSSIAAQLEDKVKVDQEKVNQLVDVYSNMKPQQAAKILESINEDLAVEVIGKMKKKNAAEILNLLAAEKAQRISEKFAGYKRK